MKKILLAANPQRDVAFAASRKILEILGKQGYELKLSLPFNMENSTDLPSDLKFEPICETIKWAQLMICLGGDGTILHLAVPASELWLPVLGINREWTGIYCRYGKSELQFLEDFANMKIEYDYG
jgi:NAD+ kinase